MIAIKGMEMPKSCADCERGSICGYGLGYGRPDDCPLVEIVTCKDCKHWQKIKDYHGRCKLFDEVWKGNSSYVPLEHGTNEEFYCQMAERREEEKYNFVDGLPRDDEYFEERMIPGNPDFCNG